MKANRLEKALETYEDVLWFMRTLMRAQGKDVSSIPVSTALRTALENGHRADDICMALIQRSSKKSLDDPNDVFKLLCDCATDFADWVHGSRRIFYVSKTLTDMLLETELPEFVPKDVKFVAPSFAIALESPVTTSKGIVHDFIMFSSSVRTSEEYGALLSLRSYFKEYDSYQRKSPAEKEKMQKAMMKNPHAREKYRQQFVRDYDKLGFKGFTILCDDDVPFNDILNEPHPEIEDREILFKIGMGLNLYLQSARKGDKEVRTRVEANPTERGKTIVHGAELFEVSVSEAFTRPSQHSEGHSGNEVRPHFRRGFWRRPKGFGQDPTALATEWVRPTWVRKDKIAEGVQPVGAFQKTDKV
jgi:hypothetical protein